ncbi:hypothetical protein HHK36_026378 [Tetracentron sinense]|uniref:Uncharacterized protein n=1 Tax=Tetracentron sinense TaxID=13715 RepID=A0A835D5E8_TETSI|nr:hypothetical protein HHK36_026378 [Tetracentron sinense]
MQTEKKTVIELSYRAILRLISTSFFFSFFVRTNPKSNLRVDQHSIGASSFLRVANMGKRIELKTSRQSPEAKVAACHSIRPGISDPPSSMVGDIFGKTWDSSARSGSKARLGIVENNPNLFGDLVGSALGQSKSNSHVPLKNAAPTSTTNSYSMGKLADTLPKNSNSTAKNNWGSSENLGSYSTVNSTNNNKTGNLGGLSLRSGVGSGAAISSKKDPFGSLVDFGTKPAINVNSTASNCNSLNTEDYSFGAFQNASKSGAPSFPSNVFPATNNNSMGSNSGSGPKMNNFGIPTKNVDCENQLPPQSTGVDPLDILFSSSSASAAAAPMASEGTGGQPFSEIDDWGLGSDFGGSDMGGTTELEGLPPPPAGVTASAAKNKGLDNHKQGQFADAIKWLSWTVVLLEKAADNAATMEVLSCRASCYKEVGEYKKAIADCTTVLEHDNTNVSVLVQRALLYESTEKYKLGTEDLRTVMKIDPGNRLARSTIHRLAKMAD